MDGDTKVFHLVAEVVRQKISPLKAIDAWGFNGSAPGPTIQVNQGDRVRVIFDNHLPEPTSISYLMALHDVWRSAVALENYTLTGGLDTPVSSGPATTTINLPNAGGSQE